MIPPHPDDDPAPMPGPSSRTGRPRRAAVGLLLAWQLGLTGLLTLAGRQDRKLGALAGMMWGLDLLWIVAGGAASLALRERVARLGRGLPAAGRLATFVAMATGLALAEEAVTTGMTNAAPWFGVEVGEVYITASADYVDVVLLHSVVVLVPQLAAWAWLLGRYDLSPASAFWLYGLTGFVDEALFAGPNPLAIAQWVLVYGLFVYLPAHLFRDATGRRPPRWWLYPAAVLLPILASIPAVILLLRMLAPGHPSIHFPPMG